MPPRDDLLERAKRRLGTVLNGKWRLDAVLGIGGMATVYAATHRNQKRVAIKMLHPEVSIDDDVTEDGAAFLVMELLEGETLDHRWEKAGRLPPADVLDIAEQLLDVLAA